MAFSVLLIMVFACGNDAKMRQKVETLWNNSEKTIDNFNYIYQLASKNPKSLDSLVDVNKVFENNKIDKLKLKTFYFNEKIDTTKTKIKVNLFLENSGSMFGYFRGRTDAESTLARLLIHSGVYFGKDELTFSFITDKITEDVIAWRNR